MLFSIASCEMAVVLTLAMKAVDTSVFVKTEVMVAISMG